MRLMTYNIYNGASKRLEEVIEIVNSVSPDVLVLNEANGFLEHEKSKLVDFASKSGFSSWCIEECGDGYSYHVAVLSKSRIIKTQVAQNMTRAAIVVQVEGFESLKIIGTHLSPHNEDERLLEVKSLLKLIKADENVVLLGDLNSLSNKDNFPESTIDTFNEGQIRKFTTGGNLRFDVLKSLEASGLIDIGNAHNCNDISTVPTPLNNDSEHANGLRLDYALVSESLIKQASSYQVVKNELSDKASDHYPVVIEIDI